MLNHLLLITVTEVLTVRPCLYRTIESGSCNGHGRREGPKDPGSSSWN